MKRWIVTNHAKTEGVIFDNECDATYASTGKMIQGDYFGVSTLAEAFRDVYQQKDDEVFPMKEVEVEL